ncbi:hypothetical protein [Sphingobacterium sp. UME9]|nr:hypothetical protein [Sphingobacterium sp. UME9]MBB1643165.1 hypothetical protein [Sphingobacterium sp. UME9]
MQHSFLKKQIHILQFLAIFMLALTCWSCKTEYPSLPYNDIESFSIQDADGKILSASIVNDQIILYWPPLVEQPENITPTIKVSELATITPASGTPIKLQSEKPITYTVRAQDGSSKNYTLTFQYNQPIVQATFNSLSSGQYYITDPNTFTFIGENIIPNETQTKGYLIDKDGKETLLSFSKNIVPTNFAVTFTAPDDFKAGTGYKVKLVSGRYSIVSDSFEAVLPSILNLLIKSNLLYSVKKGENFVAPLQSKVLYERYFKSDFDHFIAVDNLNKEYTINNAVFDVNAMTVTIPIPSNVAGSGINKLKMVDKSGKVLLEDTYYITLN